MRFYVGVPNFIQIEPSSVELQRHIDFSERRPGHCNSTSGFGFRASLIEECRNLSAEQISTAYLNARLRYYYFHFLKTSGRRIGILP